VSLLGTVRRSLRASIGLSRDRIARAPRRVLFTWFLQALVLLLLGHLIPGVLVDDILTALFAAAVIAGLNALVRPIIIVLTLPLTVATFGLLSLLINTAMIVLAAPLVPGLEVNGFVPALTLAIVLTVATTVVNVVLAIDEHESFYEELARRIEGDEVAHGPRPAGLVIIQIDGLAAPILRNAIRVGTVPRMASWVRSGAYHLAEWECPPPSQTSASQAGILHGSNDGIPAFRWYEKSSGKLLVSNHPADATEIERRVSSGDGLLAGGGSSVGNLFTGDAQRSAFVMSRMGDPMSQLDVDAFSLYFMDPAAFIRTLVLGIGEFLKELVEARRQRVQDIQPRVHRGLTFAFLRSATNVVLRDLNTTFVVRSMSLGAPVIYTDLTDYDEIAHHAGPERIESLRALTGVDQVVASLERASAYAPREYRFVLLSDHGQSQGATFKQRYGLSLEELIRGLMRGDQAVVAATSRSETFGPVNALLSELAQRPGVAGRATSAALKRPSIGGALEPGAEDPRAQVAERPDVVVCASGNLANVYFTIEDERMAASQVEERHPGLLSGLVNHPGIGFAMVGTEDGAVVIGSRGIRHLAGDRVEGEDPLADFGPRAADHLRRLDGFDNVGDLLINSAYDRDLQEVAAFEELVGSHGGMGGPQNRPFLLHPAELTLDEYLVGAPAVHQQLQHWARQLEVSAPLPSAAPEPASREPRGLRWVAGWLALLGGVELVLASILLLVGMAGEDEFGEVSMGAAALLVPLVVAGLGLVTLWAGYGIWKRQRWAWMAALVVSAFNVFQVLLALARGGFSGIVSYGALAAIVGLVMFWYLTRPHVAAAFGHRRGRKRPTGDSRSD
jgi:uncharacterized membrane protein YvlD (DUF360 family)